MGKGLYVNGNNRDLFLVAMIAVSTLVMFLVCRSDIGRLAQVVENQHIRLDYLERKLL